MSNQQINQSVSIPSTTFPMTTTTYSPIKQELSNNSNLSFALQQQQLDRNVPPNPLLDRRRSSGSIPVFSNNEGQHNLFKGEESARHQSFGAQPKNISNIRFSQEIPSYTMQNNPIGNTFNVPQQSVMLMPDKEHQKQKKKENAGFGIEEKPIHECDACGKRLCSSRSLKRHKSTCKRVKAVTEQLQGDFGSPPPPKPENISENKVKEQQNIQKQIRKISGANQISNDNKNEKVNLTQPVLRQSSSESINSQSFVLSQPSLASNNSSPIKFCTNSDSQNCGGLSSPPLVIQQQQQFYSRQPSYSSAQIQVLKQENDSKKDMEIPFKLTPVTTMDEPNKVSDVVDSVVAKLRSQNSGISGRIPTNCNTNTCNISTNNSQQQQFLPPPQHFNVPIEWNETNMPIQQFCESQQLAAPTMLYYTPVSHQQQQQHLQQRQQQFSGDINNQHGIVPNQIEQTKCPQSKPLMPPIQQQHSWQPMNPPNLQISQQPQPILAAQRNNSTENTNLLPTMLNESSTTNTMNERAEKFPCQYNNNEQIIKKQQEGQNNSGNVKNVLTECQTEKLPNSMGIKSTILSSPPQQQPPQRADIGNTSKNVYRYLCPECDKPYSCRKNVKRHRISQHKVPAQEAQDGQIKRIRLTEADLQKDGNKSKQANNKPKEVKKEEIGKEEQNKLKEKELSSDGMSRQNSTTSLTSPTRPHILQSPEHQQNHQQQPFVAPLQKPQQQIFQKQPPMQIIRDEKQYQTQQRHPYYLPYPPINQSQQEQRFVGQQLLDEQQQQQTFYEIPQHQQQYIQHQHQYNYQQQQQNLLYLDSQQQNKKYQQQQQYYGSQMISYPPPPPFQQQQPQQKIIMVQQQQQPGPSHSNNNNRLNTFYSQNNYPQQYTTIINNQNNEYPITYQEGYYQQQQQIEQQQQRQFVTYNNNSFAETLDCWEQIKSDVDTGPAAVVDADAVEMARIVEDLKRTEEVTEKRQQVRIVQQQQQTIKRQQKQQNLQFRQLDTGMIVGSESVINADNSSEMFQQNPNIQRKAVELAEADTTFSPPSQPDDSLSRQISHQSHQGVGTQQYQQKMIPLNHHHQIQQSPTTYHPQPLLSASHSAGQQQIFRFDVASVNRAPKELNSVEHEKFQQIEWNYQGGINVIPSQNKYLPPQPLPPTQQQQTIQQSPSFSTNISQENNLIINKLPTTQKLTKGESLPKNKTTKTTQQSTGTFVCPACTKAYSTDYSLKRHRNVCPVLNVGKELGKGRGNSTRKRKNTNSNNIPTSSTNNMETVKSLEKVVGETRMDEPHQIDPDSTMNESPPDNAGGSNSSMNRRTSVSGASTLSAPPNNGGNAEEQNKHVQMQMATVIQL